jgi:hypothetical protein
MENSMEMLLKRQKIKLPYDPAIHLLGIYWKECKSRYDKDACKLMLIAALFIISKLWKQLGCLTSDEWMKEM